MRRHRFGDPMTHFDPYYTWLGIPPEDHPPTLYHLLGLRDFEANPDVISNAADRQLRHIRTFNLGQHSVEAERLLNELSRARVCLLNESERAAYDTSLRTVQPLSSAPIAEPADLMSPTESRQSSQSTLLSVPSRRSTRRHRTRYPQRTVAIAIGGSVVAVLISSCFVVLVRNNSVRDRSPLVSHHKSVIRTTYATSPAATSSTRPPARDAAEPEPTAAQIADLMQTGGIGRRRPENALLNVLEEYDCTLQSQPQVTIAEWFDATKSWRLYMRVNAKPNLPEGSLFCWGDRRNGLDPISLKASKDYLSGWVQDNVANNEDVTHFKKVRIAWDGWQNIELIYDAPSWTIRVVTDAEDSSFPVKQPPRSDRKMPVILGGIGIGSDHAFPCRIRDLRLDQIREDG
ncbi:MAG: hypothetical protein H8E66_00855 [Planctomycetes bacterium]|nr:hypothetical protein [Planctomycetota bacterium]